LSGFFCLAIALLHLRDGDVALQGLANAHLHSISFFIFLSKRCGIAGQFTPSNTLLECDRLGVAPHA
jgi:hypothetical protein